MFDIAIGIPSYNESTTISHVVNQIDMGLSLYFPQLQSIIVNVDNNSPDGTKDIFHSTKTKNSKYYISTPQGIIGKGENLKNFFNLANTLSVQAAAVFDADLESITPEWINYMISPVLHSGYDFIFPVYARYRYDGAIASQFCYPLITGVFGTEIRQPIGGDFGFSQMFLQSLANSPLPDQAKTFGIDIFLTTQALIQGVRCCGVMLGQKIHRKRDRATLGPMFSDVAHSLFAQIKRVQGHSKDMIVKNSPLIFTNTFPKALCPSVPVELHALKRLFREDFPKYLSVYNKVFPPHILHSLSFMFEGKQPIFINSEMWYEILYRLLTDYITYLEKKDETADAITPLFFAKLLSFIQETKECTEEEVERYVQRQADLFFMNRKKLMDSCNR